VRAVIGEVGASGGYWIACAGDEIVAMQDLYGGTLKLMQEVLSGLGIRITLVPFAELSRFPEYLSDKTRLVILESPTNPTLRVADIAGLCAQSRDRGAVALVDNTFATPMLPKKAGNRKIPRNDGSLTWM